MRIVHLTSAHPAFDARIFRKECSSLAAAGYETILIAPHDRRDCVDGVNIHPIPKMSSRIARMTVAPWRVYREAIRERAHVYHFHDPELIPVGLLLRARGKKVIYDMHENLPQDILGKDYVPRIARRPLAVAMDCLERLSSRVLSGMVAATPSIAQRFTRLNGKLEIVQNFPMRGEFERPPGRSWGEREMSVIYAGCIARNRGLCEMIDAIGLVSGSLRATLKIAGEFAPADLRDAAALPGWKRVANLGMLSRSELSRTLGSVRAGLLVFHPAPNNIQAQPTKLFEYMAAGIPVIASDFPLWRQIVSGIGCGLVVDPLKPAEIAKAIEYLLTHSSEAEAMGIRGLEAVRERYQWDAEKVKLLRFYARFGEPACVA